MKNGKKEKRNILERNGSIFALPLARLGISLDLVSALLMLIDYLRLFVAILAVSNPLFRAPQLIPTVHRPKRENCEERRPTHRPVSSPINRSVCRLISWLVNPSVFVKIYSPITLIRRKIKKHCSPRI